MMKLVTGLVFFVLLVFAGGLGFFAVSYKVKMENLEKQNKLLMQSMTDCAEKTKQLKAMQKTIVIAYGVSEWEAKYYSYIFYDFSKHYNVPWEIYPAMVRIESNFRTTLRSPKDAKGLTQILESTAIPIAKRIGIYYITGETLWNEILNVVLGCTYLSELTISGKGTDVQENVKHGIQGYLGGPEYLKKIVANEATGQYLTSYASTVWQEYVKLTYIYKGVYVDKISESDIEFVQHKDTVTVGEKK